MTILGALWFIGVVTRHDVSHSAGLRDSRWTIVGYYNNKLLRTEQGWKIRKFNLTNLWNEGNLYLRALNAQGRQAAR